MGINQKEVRIKSLKRETLSKQVVDQIIELLMSGQLKPGDKLPPETELTDMLLVSRPVLREALTSLENMGVIQRKVREGTFFSDKIGSKPYSIMLALSAGDIPSIIEARTSLELGLVTMAAEKITDEQLQKLETNLHLLSMNKEDYSEMDKEFHRIIAYSANNPILEGIIDPLLDMIDQTLSQVSLRERNHALTLEQHHAIYEALKKRDPIEAFTSMYRHLNYGREKILKKLKEI